MRLLSEWDEEYLLEIVNGEYSNLEIKRSDFVDISKIINGTERSQKRNEFANYFSTLVSAFANFDGGYLILGMSDPKPSRPAEIDGGVSVAIKGNTKQWLEHLIPTLIEPAVKFDICLVTAKNENSKILPAHAVCVIHIYPSEHAPHQANDKKFYGRGGTNLYPLSITQIKDIIGRKTYPKLELEFVFKEAKNVLPDSPEHVVYVLSVSAKNFGNIYAKYVNVFIEIPSYILLLPDTSYTTSPDWKEYQRLRLEGKFSKFYRENIERDIVGIEYDDGLKYKENSHYIPILPKRRCTWIFLLRNDLPTTPLQNLKIKWSLFADNAPELQGEIDCDKIQWGGDIF